MYPSDFLTSIRWDFIFYLMGHLFYSTSVRGGGPKEPIFLFLFYSLFCALHMVYIFNPIRKAGETPYERLAVALVQAPLALTDRKLMLMVDEAARNHQS